MIGRRQRGVALALVLSTLPLACAGDPAKEIEARRAKYTAKLSGFVVRDVPGREKPQIVLDVLVSGGSKPPLAGLTLDVSMAGADGKEKMVRRVFVDTASMSASGAQKTVVFDDLEYQPGDGFWVEVRNAIPAAERGGYEEFGSAGSGSRS